jgi:nucleoid-associated protein YgaU
MMIRGVKGTLAVVALAAVGLGLRWMTAGSISGVNSYDLESMTVLAIGTVAWMAYGWLVLAVALTVLEQLPGALGALAGIIARRITSTAARTLLRSSLGVAAVTPLTVAVAHATPGDGHISPQTEPRSTVQLTTTNWRSTEPQSRLRLTEQVPGRRDAPAPRTRAAQPSSGRADSSTPRTRVAPTEPSSGRTDSPTTRTRVAVPDRPAVGAPTRYTDLRSGVAGRVVVKAGDSLWSLAAHELGPGASAAAVAARWPEWYAANRQVIGSDPDLILPGQVLRIPAAATSQHVPPTHQEK